MSMSVGLQRIAKVIRVAGALLGAAFLVTAAIINFNEPQNASLWHWIVAAAVAAGIYAVASTVAWVIEGFASRPTA